MEIKENDENEGGEELEAAKGKTGVTFGKGKDAAKGGKANPRSDKKQALFPKSVNK